MPSTERSWWEGLAWRTFDNKWTRIDQYEFSTNINLLDETFYITNEDREGVVLTITDVSDGSECPAPDDNDDVIDFNALSTDYESLPDSEKKSETLTGKIVYQDISGGFYGVETDSVTGGEKILPINIQSELEGLEGKLLKITTGYSRNSDVSIFMWGTLVYVTDFEILDESGVPVPDDGIVFEIEGSKIYGFDLKIKTDTGFLKEGGTEIRIETEGDNIHVPSAVLDVIKDNIETCTHFELKTLPHRSFDKETCGLIELDRVFRYPILLQRP